MKFKTEREFEELSVCADCFMLDANMCGDLDPIGEDWELGFSWSNCDICREHNQVALGGDRFLVSRFV